MFKIIAINFLIPAVCIMSALKCGNKKPDEQKIIINRDFQGDEQVFFSTENPGKWIDYKVDHQIKIRHEKEKTIFRVDVELPLLVTTDHFIENIVLLDSTGKEIDSTPLDRGQKPRSTFWISTKNSGRFYVVAKCNLHDMWRSSFDIK